MNAIKLCRLHLKLTQSAFGIWLGHKTGHEPYPATRICEFEHGINGNKAIRAACAPVATKAILFKLRNEPECNHADIIIGALV